MNFDAGAVCACSGESPFRHPSLANDEMARTAPVSIRERRPDFGEASSNSFTADISSAADVGTGRCFEHAIVGHEGHKGIDIVAIPGIGEVLQDLDGDLLNNVRHDHEPPLRVQVRLSPYDAQRRA